MAECCVSVQEQTPGEHTECANLWSCYINMILDRVSNEDGAYHPQSELVTFIDEQDSEVVGGTAGNHAFSSGDGTVNTDIQQFFARPVRISMYTWSESTVAGSTANDIDPWRLWAQNAFVKNKLNNYAWFRGDLHVKIMITASPFYYGLLKTIYHPLPNFTPSTIVNDAGTRYLIPYSQRPHVDITIGEVDSYNMVLPFIYPANWVNIQKSSNMTDLGRLQTLVYSQLKSANGVTAAGVSVSVYAWVENIELSGASVGYSMQSDEFGEGSVSKPASWVAKGASYFESWPIIGPFATATRIGAGAVGAIAALFGFTNVPVIADTSPMRSECFPKFSSSEIGYPIERLTLDPKNELSVDPRITGLASGKDEMTLVSMATRESFLAKAVWSTTNQVDATLFYSNVAPTLYDNDGGAQSKLYMTPMAHVAKAFKDWRGSVIFRFHIVSSKYHKGKLRISFDPSGYAAQHVGNTTISANVVHTAIVDLGVSNDIEFAVPYQQALQFLVVRSAFVTSNQFWKTNTEMSAFSYDGNYDNGSIIVRVLNQLTAPVLTSEVDILVYVRAGDDIEFANPTPVDTSARISVFAPQSEEISEPIVAKTIVLSETRSSTDDQYLVHYGENIRSLRQLLRRYELVQVEGVIPASTNSYGHFSKGFMKMPLQPGFKSNGYSLANTIVAAETPVGYNFSHLTALSWFAPAFLCYRGSMNWSFDVTAPYSFQHLRVNRDNVSRASADLSLSQTAYTTTNQLEAMVRQYNNSGASGQCLTNQTTQSGINVQVPNYSRWKFQSTNPSNNNQGVVVDGSDLDRFQLQGAFPTPVSLTNAAPTIIHSYVGIGVDYGLYIYLNVPTFYVYSVAPAPA